MISIDDRGRLSHKCAGVEGWDDIYLDHEGDWILSINAGDGKTDINFCPWCGIKFNSPEMELEKRIKLEEVDEKGLYKYLKLREKNLKDST